MPAPPRALFQDFYKGIGNDAFSTTMVFVGPFMMAVINVKNVHRSNLLMGHAYGRDFVYDEMVMGGPAGSVGFTDLGSLPGGGPKPGEGPTKEERKRAIAFHRAVGDHAAKKNVRFAVEALNRFECYFLNTMAQLAAYLDEVDHPAIKGMYDTFHANIEEKDIPKTIKDFAGSFIHVHISENDRGTPGTGQVNWDATFGTLKEVKYDGWMVIEAFGRALPDLAAATRIWRDLFPSPEDVYTKGLAFMKSAMPGRVGRSAALMSDLS